MRPGWEQLAIRADDRESAVRERLDAYEARTRPLLDEFCQMEWRLHEINSGAETPEALSRAVCRLIKGE